MREVVAYGDFKVIQNHPYYDSIKKSYHITDTNNTAKLVNNSKLFEHRAVSISTFMQEIIPDWRNENTRFAQYLTISKILNDMERNIEGEGKLLLKGFRKNTFEVYSALRLLTESKLSPEDLKELDDSHIDLLQAIWSEAIVVDPTFKKLWNDLDSLKDTTFLENLFLKIFKSNKIESIVFHNFYFITPIQEAVIRSLEECGIVIIMAGPLEDHHQFISEIWKKSLKEEYGYPPYEEWKFGDYSKEDPFGDMIEGYCIRDNKDITIKEYDSPLSFVQDINENYSKEWELLSPDEDEANKIMYTLSPDYRTAHNFLSYPIGRYIDALYKLWDDEIGDIIITEDILYECFSSGWIKIGDKDSRDYMEDLDNLIGFFKGCRTIDEWNNRLEQYQNIINDAISIMDTTKGESYNREDCIMGNPLKYFSMFSVDQNRANVVFKIICDIVMIASSLFVKKGQMNVKDHLMKLKNMVMDNHATTGMNYDETIILDALKTKIQRFENLDLTCYPSDISGAITDYLGDRYVQKESDSFHIKPFDDICGLNIKEGKKIHICLCDINRLPGKASYIWPLNKTVIDKICAKKVKNDKKALIKQLKCIIEESPARNRYLMGLLMRNDHIVLSWISTMNNKAVNPSPYITLIEDATGIKPEIIRRADLNTKMVFDTIKTNNIDKLLEIKEAQMDFALCLYRYIYGYILSDRPVIKDKFLQQFAISGMIKAINNITKSGDIENANQVLELFPNLINVEKKQIKDFTRWVDTNDSTMARYSKSSSGREYTNQRLRIYFASPNNYILKKALNQMNEKKIGVVNTDYMVCRYCPFRDNCIYTNFDKEND